MDPAESFYYIRVYLWQHPYLLKKKKSNYYSGVNTANTAGLRGAWCSGQVLRLPVSPAQCPVVGWDGGTGGCCHGTAWGEDGAQQGGACPSPLGHPEAVGTVSPAPSHLSPRGNRARACAMVPDRCRGGSCKQGGAKCLISIHLPAPNLPPVALVPHRLPAPLICSLPAAGGSEPGLPAMLPATCHMALVQLGAVHSARSQAGTAIWWEKPG